MRKNCSEVVESFLIGQPLRKAQSIWTDGDTIFSYGTAIVERRFNAKGVGRFLLNRTKYSVTTSTHQGAIAARFNRYGLNYEEVEGVAIGSKVVAS